MAIIGCDSKRITLLNGVSLVGGWWPALSCLLGIVLIGILVRNPSLPL